MRKLTSIEIVLACVCVLTIYLLLSNSFRSANVNKNEIKLYDQLIATQEQYVQELNGQLKISLQKINSYELQLKQNEENRKQELDSIANMSPSELHSYITDNL